MGGDKCGTRDDAGRWVGGGGSTLEQQVGDASQSTPRQQLQGPARVAGYDAALSIVIG